jgi:hypothetical protein
MLGEKPAKSNAMPVETKRKIVGQGCRMCCRKSKTAKDEPWPCDGLGADYFLALQTAQVAQVVLPSVQHCIPQAAVLDAVDLLEAQPAQRAETQTIRARSFNDFMVFIFWRPLAPGLHNYDSVPEGRRTEEN